MIAYYYIFINLLLFALMGIDKFKAVHKKWRIPEAHLFAAAFLGGGIGGVLGMQIFRHKTKKPIFYFMFGLSIIVHIIILKRVIF